MTKLEQLRALMKAATPGPWRLASGDNIFGGDGRLRVPQTSDDALLIVAAVNALPALLDVAEAAVEVRRRFMAIDDGFYTGLVPPEFAPLLEPLAQLEAPT